MKRCGAIAQLAAVGLIVEQGGLLACAPSLRELERQAAGYVPAPMLSRADEVVE